MRLCPNGPKGEACRQQCGSKDPVDNLESSHIDITPGRPQTDEDETKGRTKQTARKSAPASENKCKKMCPSGPSGKECRDQCDESDFLDA